MSLAGKRIGVVGAGLGGISSAIALAAEGCHVEIFEKNDQIGGKLNLLEKKGFSFDLGPSIFTLPQYFRSLFEKAGKRFEDYVELQAVEPHWRNFFEDGTVFDLHKDRGRMQDELAKLPGSTPDNWDRFLRFMDYAKAQYNIIERGYFAHGLDNLWEFLRFYGLKKLSREIDYKRRMNEGIRAYFSDPHLCAAFEYFIKYVGSSAYNAPGYMNLMPHIQYEYDLWYVRGGMYNLAKGLGRLMKELGIAVHLSAEVKAISHQGRRVTGLVLTDGPFVKADYIVCNMEVIPAYECLLRESPRFLRKLAKFEPACSGLVIHLGTDRIYPQLAHHNFFYSTNQEKHFDTVFNRKELPDDPTIYLVAPTRTDSTQAPPGCDNIKILPHIPYLRDDNPPSIEDYRALRERILNKLERMGLTDLRKHTVVEDFWTPRDIQARYYSNRGSIYGVVSDWKRNHGFKAPKQSRKYRNLFFTGGSVNPGGGMPMVTLCGQKVADRIKALESS